MKNIFKSILALASFAVVAVSCDTDFVGQTYSLNEVGASAVSFVQNVVSDTELEATQNTYDIPVARSSAEGAITCDLKTDLPEGVCPASVSFEAGQFESVITINLSTIPVGKLLKGSIELLEQPKFSNNKINVSLQKSYRFEPYGTVKITDDLVTSAFGVKNVTWEVTALKAAGVEVYRLLDPYGANYPYNGPGEFKEGAKWDIDATNPDAVTFERTYLGFNWGYGEFNVWPLAAGKMVNKVITFPVNGIAFDLPDEEATLKANNSGLFKIDLNL